jgi:hypothetical protein
MLAAVEHRFGLINRLPVTFEWLTDNGLLIGQPPDRSQRDSWAAFRIICTEDQGKWYKLGLKVDVLSRSLSAVFEPAP